MAVKVLPLITVLTAVVEVVVFCTPPDRRYHLTVTESRWAAVALQERMAITLVLILRTQLVEAEAETTEGLLLESTVEALVVQAAVEWELINQTQVVVAELLVLACKVVLVALARVVILKQLLVLYQVAVAVE